MSWAKELKDFPRKIMLLIFRNAVSSADITKWYKYRAFEIERLSRQADFALELVKLGVERGVQVRRSVFTQFFSHFEI